MRKTDCEESIDLFADGKLIAKIFVSKAGLGFASLVIQADKAIKILRNQTKIVTRKKNGVPASEAIEGQATGSPSGS